MCKGNIAAYVRRTLPHGICGRWLSNVLAEPVVAVTSHNRMHLRSRFGFDFSLDCECI